MRILSYSPSVEVYVAASGNGTVRYYDLSKDVTSCSVSRIQDGVSTCTVSALNENGKYNGVFSPMDRITVFASKRERRLQVFTGYITSVPNMTMYPGNFSISCSCSLYRLQKLYWDPGLFDSRSLMRYGDANGTYEGIVRDILSAVCGMPDNMVLIGEMPSAIEDFARDLYTAQKTDIGNIENMAKQFHDMLASTNLVSSFGASAGPASFSGSDNQEIIWNFCISQGFSKAAAAAVIGNAQAESGCTPDRNQDGGPAKGMFQWEGGRFDDLCAVAAEMNTDWTDIKAQLTHLKNELGWTFDAYTGITGYYGNGEQWGWAQSVSFDEWRTWTDVAKATECFCRVYERPSIPHMDNRIRYAQEAYDRFGR